MLFRFIIGMNKVNSRLDITENHVSEPENKVKKFSQNQQKKKRQKRMM